MANTLRHPIIGGLGLLGIVLGGLAIAKFIGDILATQRHIRYKVAELQYKYRLLEDQIWALENQLLEQSRQNRELIRILHEVMKELNRLGEGVEFIEEIKKVAIEQQKQLPPKKIPNGIYR